MYIVVAVSQLASYLLLHQIWVVDFLTHQLSNSVTLFHWEDEQRETKPVQLSNITDRFKPSALRLLSIVGTDKYTLNQS